MTEITAEEFVRKVAQRASMVGMLANVGAMELAGQIVSVLAAHPEQIPLFMDDLSGWMMTDIFQAENGCLSFVAINGAINTPANLRKLKGQNIQ